MYAYKRIGLTDDVKQSILKIFEGTSLGNISNTHMSKRSPFWIEDRLVVREWWRRDISEVLRDLDTSLYYGSFRDESTEIRDYQFKTRFKWLYYHDKDQPADTLTAYKRGYKEKADYFILIPIEEIMEMLPNFYAYIKNNTNWLTIVKMRQ